MSKFFIVKNVDDLYSYIYGNNLMNFLINECLKITALIDTDQFQLLMLRR